MSIESPGNPRHRTDPRREGILAKGLDAQQKIFAGNPGDRRAFEALEEHFFLDGDWDALVDVYRNRLKAADVEEDDEQQAPLLFRLGQILEERILDLPAATKVYWNLAKLDPTNRPALRQLRNIHERNGQWDLVLQIAELESATAMPAYDRAVFETELGRVWQQRLNDSDEARCAYERALEADPDFPAALEGLAALHQEAKRFQDAADVLTRLTERLRGPERAPVWVALGTLFATELEDAERALECFDHALEDDPFQPPAVEWSLLLRTAAEDWPAVAELLERRFDLASGARHRAAIAVEASQIQLNHLNSSAGARAWADRAIELSTNEISVLLAVAEVDRADQDLDALLVTLDNLITVAGEHAPRAALIEAAELHSRFGNPDAALDAVRRASQKSGSDDVRVLTLQASLLRDCGSKRELAEVLETLTVVDGGIDHDFRVEHLRELASLQEEDLGEAENALVNWQSAFELDSSHPETLAALERLHRKSDDWPALKQLLETAIDSTEGPAQANPLASLGNLLLDHFEDAPEARLRFEAALSLASDCRPARLGLRRIAELTNDSGLLLRACEHDAEDCTDPSEMADLASSAIVILERDERFEDALGWATRWSEGNPRSSDAFAARARLEEKLGLVDDEIESHRKLAKLLDGPERTSSLRRQADLLLQSNDYEAAAVALELALKDDPSDSELLRSLCTSYRSLDRAPNLAKSLRRLTESLAPSEQAKPLEELAQTLLDPIGDLDAAIVVRWQLTELDSAPDDAFSKLEDALKMAGRYAELAHLLETQRQELGDESEEALSLDLRRGAILLDSLGQSEEAAKIFSAIHERHPDNEAVLEQLERALRIGNDARGLCDLIERRAGWESDEVKKCAMHLERASLLEEVLGDSMPAADLYEEIIRTNADMETTSTASHRLELLLESNGEWERLRDRLIARAEHLATEDQATVRERVAAICFERLHDVPECAAQLEAIARLVPDRVHVWQKLAEIYTSDLDRPGDWLRVTEAELASEPSAERELSLRVAAARLILDDDRRPADRNADEAYTHYERALELHPTHAEAAEVLALVYCAAERHEDTVRILERRLDGLRDSTTPEATDLQLRLGALFSDSLEDDTRARPLFEAARATLGATPQVAEPLADLYQRVEAFDELRSLCREAVESQSNQSEKFGWQARLGAAARHCGDLEEATSAYRAALAKSPDDRDIEDALIELYEEVGEVDPLTDLLEKRLPFASEEEAIDLRLMLARLNAQELNRPLEALEHLEWILNSHPQHRDAFSQALQLADQIGDPNRILVLLDQALSIPLPSNDRAIILERRATLLTESMDQPEQAVANLREVLALNPRNQSARQTLRRGLESLRRWPAVLDCLFVEAQEADSERRIELLEEAAEIAWTQVNPDASLPWLARLRAERPEDPELLARLAEVHRRAGRFEAALRAYDEELTLRRDLNHQSRLHIHRARLLERELHAPGRAIFAYLRAAETAVDDSEILIELDRLYDTMGRPIERAEILESRVARLSQMEGIELRQTLAALYCTDLSRPDLALPHLEANAEAARGNPREELRHLGALDAALRASTRHDAWACVAERELELIESKDEIRESTPKDYLRFLREELAHTYDVELGAPDRAIEHLCKLADDNEAAKKRTSHKLRGLFRRTGRLTELAENLACHLESDQGSSDEWLELARLREEKLGDLSGAIEAYQHAEADCDHPLLAIRGRRRCCERLQDWTGLADALESEFQQESLLDRHQRTTLARRLGDLCWQRLGSASRASHSYRLALELDSSDLVALRALIRVTETSEDVSEISELYRQELTLLGDSVADRQRQNEIWLRIATIAADSEDSQEEAIEALLEAASIDRLSSENEFRLARLYESTGAHTEFTEAFGRWCDREDSEAEVKDHLELARHHQTHSEKRLARTRAERATAVDPESTAAWSLLAEIERSEEDFEKAASAFERAAEHAPANQAANLLTEGADCVRGLSLDQAQTLLTRAAELDPGSLSTRIALTRVASEQDQLDITQQEAERALELALSASISSETRLEIAMLGGRAARTLGHRDASRRFFQIAIEIDGDQIEALEGVAEAHFDDGDFDSVRILLEHRLEIEGENPLLAQHHAMIARSLEAEDLLDVAWSHYEEALELDSSIEAAHEGLVRIHERAGRLSEAQDALEWWAKSSGDPERKAMASFRAGEHALATEDSQRAERNLKLATEADPSLSPAWVLLCQVIGDHGIDRDSRRVCNEALEAIEPSPLSAQISLRAARLAEITGDNDEAIEHYNHAAQWDRRCHEAALCQSRLIRMAGDWMQADAVLARFIDAHPDAESPTLAQVHLERGRLLAGPLEDCEPAISAYEEALRLQPDLRVARTSLAALLLHSADRWRDALALHRDILAASPTTAGSLRAIVELAKMRSQNETADGALAILRALGLASPKELNTAPKELRLPIQPGPPMPQESDERLRRIAHQLRDELGTVLATAESDTADCDDPEVNDAIRQIGLIEDELTAPHLARLHPDDRAELFQEIGALFLDPGGNSGTSKYRAALDHSIGRWTRRKIRRIVEETDLEALAQTDHVAWGDELRAMAAAQAIDRNGSGLRTSLQALLILSGELDGGHIPEGAEIGTLTSASEPARRLLIRITQMLCKRLEQAS